jgi:hypothetical protein
MRVTPTASRVYSFVGVDNFTDAAAVWVPVPGWPEYSIDLVSSAVRSEERIVVRRNGSRYHVRQRILKPKRYPHSEHVSVCLARDHQQFTIWPHVIRRKLLAERPSTPYVYRFRDLPSKRRRSREQGKKRLKATLDQMQTKGSSAR